MKMRLRTAVLIIGLTIVSPRLGMAGLIIDIVGTPGSGSTTWTFSGSTSAYTSGTFSVEGSEGFNGGDTNQPGELSTGNDKNFIIPTSMDDQLFIRTSGGASITTPNGTQQLTEIFLDDDGVAKDDVGFHTATALGYASSDVVTWSGSNVFGVDMDTFAIGSFGRTRYASATPYFVAVGVNNLIINTATATAIPEPSTFSILATEFTRNPLKSPS